MHPSTENGGGITTGLLAEASLLSAPITAYLAPIVSFLVCGVLQLVWGGLPTDTKLSVQTHLCQAPNPFWSPTSPF